MTTKGSVIKSFWVVGLHLRWSKPTDSLQFLLQTQIYIASLQEKLLRGIPDLVTLDHDRTVGI